MVVALRSRRLPGRAWWLTLPTAAAVALSCVAREPYQPTGEVSAGTAGKVNAASSAGKGGLTLTEPAAGGAGSPASVGGSSGGPASSPDSECLTSAQCASPYPYCLATTERCVECLSNRNCSGTGLSYCNTKTNLCVSCLADSQCPHSTPYCAPSLGRCVECLSTDNCGVANRACDRESFHCVPTCSTHVDCASSGATPYCDPERSLCVACVTDDGCSSTTPRCAFASKTCVECLEDADCAFPSPLCDPRKQACVECLSNADCQPGVFCVAGMCADPK